MIHDSYDAPRSVSDSWKRIDDWMSIRFPQEAKTLNRPADMQQIHEYERQIGFCLPPSVVESFAIHDGQQVYATGVVFGLLLLSLEESRTDWMRWRNADRLNETFAPTMSSVPPGAIRAAYSLPGWIPLTRDWGGNHLGVDLNPGENGLAGQVITFGRDEQCKYLVSPSWQHFLHFLCEQLECGNIVFGLDGDGTGFNLREPRNTHFHDAVAEMYRRYSPQKSD